MFGGELYFLHRSTFIKYPVFSPKFTFDDEGNMIAAEGFLVDMLYLIQDQLNFTASLSITVDGKFGGKAQGSLSKVQTSRFKINDQILVFR